MIRNALQVEIIIKKQSQMLYAKTAGGINQRNIARMLRYQYLQIHPGVKCSLESLIIDNMKKLLILLTALMIFAACGVTRRAVKTEISTEVTQQTQTTDTTSRASTWEQLVTAISNQIDLSKIHIIQYSPERDSTGQQVITSEIKIDRNVTTTTTAQAVESANEQENRIITESTATQATEQITQEVKEKTGSSPLKLYLIIALLAAVVLLILYLKYKSVIGAGVKKIIGIFR